MNTQKAYTDYELSKLIFGPGGVWEFLDKQNKFRNKFGCDLNRTNFTDAIGKVIPEIDQYNKDRKNMQPFVSIYNTVQAGTRKKDALGQCHAIQRTYEIIYVFCHVERTRISGLEEFLRKKGHGQLVDAAKEVYTKVDEERKKAIYMHDIAARLWKQFDELENLVMANKEEVLEAILEAKEKEVEEAKEEKEETRAEIRKEFEDTPDDELRNKIYRFVDNL